MSPTASFPKPVGVTCANATTGSGVKAYNRTTGVTETTTVTSGKAVIELTGYTVGDIVEFRVSGGKYSGANTLTLTAGKATPQNITVSMTENTTTNTPAINF